MDNKKLHVGGLSYGTSETQLEELFSAHGTVESAQVITDRDSGRSRGFGFVEMSSTAEAEEAAKQIDGTEVDGRTVTDNEAKPRSSGGQSSGRGRW